MDITYKLELRILKEVTGISMRKSTPSVCYPSHQSQALLLAVGNRSKNDKIDAKSLACGSRMPLVALLVG